MLAATTTFSDLELETQSIPNNLDRNKVVEQYAHLIKKVAYRMIARLPANVEMDDLMSAGVIGLIDAAEKYDPEKSCNFKSYAEIRIRGAMVDELRSLDWVPRSVRQKGASIDVVARELQGKLGRPATELEVAAEMGLSEGPEGSALKNERRVGDREVQTTGRDLRLKLGGCGERAPSKGRPGRGLERGGEPLGETCPRERVLKRDGRQVDPDDGGCFESRSAALRMRAQGEEYSEEREAQAFREPHRLNPKMRVLVSMSSRARTA